MVALILSILAAAFSWLGMNRFCLSDGQMRDAASAYVSVDVTMLGFMLAMLAILGSVFDRRLIRNMAKTGHLRNLIKKLYWTGGYFLLSMITALLSLFLSGDILVVFLGGATGLLVGAIYQLLFVGSTLRRMLTIAPDGGGVIEQ